MSIFVRTKRVTDPLDDRVKACICGTGGGFFRQPGSVASGSGSEHEADACFLDDLANGFLEEPGDCEDCDAGAAGESGGSEEDEGGNSGPGSGREDPCEAVRALLDPGSDRYRRRLWSEAAAAAEAFASLRGGESKDAFRRAVMASLREMGHNAGVCKTRWETSGGLTGGNYEFIDVVARRGGGGSGYSSPAAAPWTRYFVELDLAGEFEIARPTEEFSRVVRVLPKVFVGKSEEVKQIVRWVSEAARRSLKKRGMHLPPWRKNRYMQAKWLGPYRRTVNMGSHSPAPPSSLSRDRDLPAPAVRCRSVGFFSAQETPVGNRRFVV